MHDTENAPTAEVLLEAARQAGREEARRILRETADRLERQARMGSGDHPTAPLDGYAVLGALRSSLGG